MKQFWPYLKPYRKWLVLGVLCAAAEAFLELLIPLLMAEIVDVGIQNLDTVYTVQLGAVMVALAVVALSLGVLSAYFSARTGQSFGAEVRAAEFARIQSFSFHNIERFSTASLITRMTNDVTAVQTTVMMGMRLLVRAPVMLVSASVLAMLISTQLSRVFVAAVPVLVLAIVLILKTVGPMFRKMQERTDNLNLVVQEDLTAIRTVKAFVREAHEEEKFEGRNRDLFRMAETAYGRVVVTMPLMQMLIYGTIIAILWFGGHMVDAGTLEVGLLTTFITYVMQIMISLMMVSMMFMMLTRAVACGRRIQEVLREEPDITEHAAVAGQQVENGSVEFSHVSFKYEADSPEWTLEDLNFKIEAGETVGIIGGTGSGKTSLVQLIPRLYQAQQGEVLVGGKPVETYSLRHLRESCAMVLQQNTLFSGTIRENLLWGKEDATEAELAEACRIACVDEFLGRLPKGLDTDLGQGGVNVSGGQKQRLCIARAVLAQPKILIFDDSTSAVDMATDARIRNALRESLAGTTKIIIAQRIASVQDADKIFVLDEGRLVACGAHGELLKTCGIYREVYTSQQEGGSIDG